MYWHDCKAFPANKYATYTESACVCVPTLQTAGVQFRWVEIVSIYFSRRFSALTCLQEYSYNLYLIKSSFFPAFIKLINFLHTNGIICRYIFSWKRKITILVQNAIIYGQFLVLKKNERIFVGFEVPKEWLDRLWLKILCI